MHTSKTSTLIANIPKSFILSQFKPAYSPQLTGSTHIWAIFHFRSI